MDAARIVPDHPADRAAAVRRRVRSKREMKLLGRVTYRVKDDAGFDTGKLLVGIKLDNTVHVLRKIEQHAKIHRLAGNCRPASTGEYGSSVFTAHSDSR